MSARGVATGMRGPQWAGERASSSSRARNLRGLARLVAPYRTRAALALVALLVGTAASIAPPLLAKEAIDRGIAHHDTTALAIVVAAFLLAGLLLWAMTYVQTYLVGWIGQRALADLRIRIFTHLQGLSIGFYDSRPAGVLISRMTNDVEALDSLVTDSVVTLFQAGLTLVGTIVILLVLDVKLALLTFAIFPLLAGGSLWFRLVSASAFRRTRETIGSITAYLQETLSGIRAVRSFAQEPRHERRFAELNADNRDANYLTVKLNARYFPTVEMLSGIAVAGIVLYGGIQAIDGHITVGTVVAFVAALSYLFEPIQQLSQLYTTYQSGMAALEKIFQLLDSRPDVIDEPHATKLARVRGEIRFEDVSFSYAAAKQRARRPIGDRPAREGTGSGAPEGAGSGAPEGNGSGAREGAGSGAPEGAGSGAREGAGSGAREGNGSGANDGSAVVALERNGAGAAISAAQGDDGAGANGVTAAGDDGGARGRAAKALNDVNITIVPGQTVALVGATGAGKSTMAKLIARFYDPTSGRVLIDGHDLRTVQSSSLRSQMGIVPQEAFLFSGTIGENIAFGRPDASDEEIREAAAAVGADTFIEALEHGYDTEVGERGAQFSSGQRQLVAFARALIADPRILVLDEATSNVDIHTEGRIEEGLRRLLAGRTAIVIAHRLSTIRQAARIVVLEHGRIVEQGTHDELIAAGGRYYDLYRDWATQAAA